jgi:iron complex transport system permease protein
MTKQIQYYIAFITLSFVVLWAGIFYGSASIPFVYTIKIMVNAVIPGLQDLSAIKNSYQVIIAEVRLPRAIAAYFTGAALSLIGALYQSIFRNPMAEPYILGISSGAALGGVIAMIFFQSIIAVSGASFIAALAALLIVYSISRKHIKLSMNAALLCGIAFSQFAAALISFLMIMNRDKIERIYMWLLGSFAGIEAGQTIAISATSIMAITGLSFLSSRLDIMALGDETARTLGVNTEGVRLIIILSTSFMLCIIIPITGIIGFAGLIVPHFTRMLIGRKHKLLLPFSFILGGIFLALSDILARSVFTETELPVGIITAFIGAPYFIYLSYTKRGSAL